MENSTVCMEESYPHLPNGKGNGMGRTYERNSDDLDESGHDLFLCNRSQITSMEKFAKLQNSYFLFPFFSNNTLMHHGIATLSDRMPRYLTSHILCYFPLHLYDSSDRSSSHYLYEHGHHSSLQVLVRLKCSRTRTRCITLPSEGLRDRGLAQCGGNGTGCKSRCQSPVVIKLIRRAGPHCSVLVKVSDGRRFGQVS
jgi:hypothetical protein